MSGRKRRKRRILVVAHHMFTGTFRAVRGWLGPEWQVDVISNRDVFWRRKRGLLRRLLVAQPYDVVHFHCAYLKPLELFLFKYLCRVRVINQFMGTDLYRILNGGPAAMRLLRRCASLCEFRSVGYVLRNELRECGLDGDVVHLMEDALQQRDYGYPAEPGVLVYLPSGARDFYQYGRVRALAEALPDIPFAWFPYEPAVGETLPGNVTAVPHIPHARIFDEMEKYRVFLRLPVHDGGAPLSLIEALSIGRWAVWSYAMTGVETPADDAELREVCARLAVCVEPNREGEQYALSEFSRERITAGFVRLYSGDNGDGA